MNVKAALQATRALIADKARWCQGRRAQQKNGNIIRFDSPQAVCWCADGALLRSTGAVWTPDEVKTLPVYRECVDLLDWIAKELFPVSQTFVGVNDQQGHDAILRVIDLAIERAQP